MFLKTPQSSEIVRHVCLDVINNAIKVGQLEEQSLLLLSNKFLEYIQIPDDTGRSRALRSDSISLQNKSTQVFTNLFTAMYGSLWTSFFQDFLSMAKGDKDAETLYYLRILISVHEEIANVLRPRSPHEQRRDGALKDLVRERDIGIIAASWQELLLRYQSKDQTVVEFCLGTIGRWATWIDLSLIINDFMLQFLFQTVSQPERTGTNDSDALRDVAIETFIEILAKKMNANDKLELIEILRIQEVVSQLSNSRALTELRTTSNYDTDFAENVARLVNNTMVDVIKALGGTELTAAAAERGINQLNAFLPFVIRFFSDEYDEICSTVIPCLMDLLTLMRKKVKNDSAFMSQCSAMLHPILDAVVAKMKYDDTASWGNEDAQTDEAEFQELRKRLHVLQQAVAAVDEPLFFQKISSVVNRTFESFNRGSGQPEWRDVDLAMHELYLFGELGLKGGGLYSKTRPVSTAAEYLIGMMFKFVETGKSLD